MARHNFRREKHRKPQNESNRDRYNSNRQMGTNPCDRCTHMGWAQQCDRQYQCDRTGSNRATCTDCHRDGKMCNPAGLQGFSDSRAPPVNRRDRTQQPESSMPAPAQPPQRTGFDQVQAMLENMVALAQHQQQGGFLDQLGAVLQTVQALDQPQMPTQAQNQAPTYAQPHPQRGLNDMTNRQPFRRPESYRPGRGRSRSPSRRSRSPSRQSRGGSAVPDRRRDYNNRPRDQNPITGNFAGASINNGTQSNIDTSAEYTDKATANQTACMSLTQTADARPSGQVNRNGPVIPPSSRSAGARLDDNSNAAHRGRGRIMRLGPTNPFPPPAQMQSHSGEGVSAQIERFDGQSQSARNWLQPETPAQGPLPLLPRLHENVQGVDAGRQDEEMRHEKAEEGEEERGKNYLFRSFGGRPFGPH